MLRIFQKSTSRTLIYFRSIFFSQIKEVKPRADVDKILAKYHIDQLDAYKNEEVKDDDFKRMRLTNTSTVKQIYISWTNHYRLFNSPNFPDKEVTNF